MALLWLLFGDAESLKFSAGFWKYKRASCANQKNSKLTGYF